LGHLVIWSFDGSTTVPPDERACHGLQRDVEADDEVERLGGGAEDASAIASSTEIRVPPATGVD
jgi:hypothetical protein